MYVVKVLKRKDGASLVVGIAVAWFVAQFAGSVVQELSGRISQWQWGKDMGNQLYPGGDWKVTYLQPFVALLLELIVLEILVRVYIWLHSQFGKNW